MRVPSPHGTRSRYNKGCRCATCTRANRDYLERWRRAKGMKPQKYGLTHGISCYSRGCRCEVGRAATSEYRRAQARRAS